MSSELFPPGALLRLSKKKVDSTKIEITLVVERVTPPECEKWILYKISHRLSGPIFFLTQNFSTKKIILKVGIFDF